MRTLIVSIVFATVAAAAAHAGVTTYPPSYHSGRAGYYESLRMAKIAWLRANLAAMNTELTQDRAGLATLSGQAAIDKKTVIGRLTAQIGQIEAELKVMSGQRDTRQEALLKRNVQSWIGAARRGGDGGEAIRLMHDLEGTGL